MLTLPIWDVGTLRNVVGDDLPMQGRMLKLFLREALEQVPAIERAAAGGEMARTADLAHLLKASARMVGALRMGLLCEAIETAGDDRELANCCAAVQGLAAAFSAAQLQITMQMAVPSHL